MVQIKLNHRKFEQILSNQAQISALRAGLATKARIRRTIVRKGLINTGQFYSSISMVLVKKTFKQRKYKVYSAVPQATYQEYGRRAYIYPKKAKALRFKPKGASKFVLARRVKGYKAQSVFRGTYRSVSLKDFV